MSLLSKLKENDREKLLKRVKAEAKLDIILGTPPNKKSGKKPNNKKEKTIEVN